MGVINNSASDTIVTGTSGNDSIRNSGNYVTIDGGDGNDTVVIHYASKVNAGDGNDVIRDGNDGTSEDGISHYGSTINGGAGNDTIYAYSSWDGTTTFEYTDGGGADTFVYEKGDGKDFIFGFGNDDLLEIVGMGQKVTGTFNKAGDTFTVKAGTTTVAVLKDFSATTFNVTADGTSHQFKK